MHNSNLYFDIETTGLSAYKSHVTVIGTAAVINGETILKQFICDRPTDESETISDFVNYAKDFTGFIHFNGKTFDIPYIRNKCTFFGLEDPFENKESIDIYTNAKKLAPLLSLTSLKQKDFEQVFQYPRTDGISGKECIDEYKAYMMTGDEKHMDLIKLHNKDDVLGMVHIKKHLDSLSNLLSNPLSNISYVLDENSLSITCTGCEAISYPVHRITTINNNETCFDISCSINGSSINIKVTGKEICAKRFYSNYKEYYYLPEEGHAIHSSVACFVDSAFKKKATKETAFEPYHGLLFPKLKASISPEFKNCTKDKVSFFRYIDLNNENIYELIQDYLQILIK